jgi:hypothetical protein
MFTLLHEAAVRIEQVASRRWTTFTAARGKRRARCPALAEGRLAAEPLGGREVGALRPD